MMKKMGSSGSQFKIFDGIVQLVAVDMMNYFTALERPSKVTSHDGSMLKGQLSIDVNLPVSVIANTAGSIWSFGHISSSMAILSWLGGTAVINWVNSGKLLPGYAGDNPERSREYTPGTCNDYRRASAPLMTGLSAQLAREEIV